MQVPLEISFRDVEKSETIKSLVREKVNKLEQICDYITSCRVAIEKPHSTVRAGNPYRVRLDISVPPGHSVVISKEPGNSEMHDSLEMVIRDAFDAARKKLQKLVHVQRQDVKEHPQQEVTAIVTKLFPDEGYGFIRTINGREVYFHKNSLLNIDFQTIKEGDGVRFFEEDGEKGPQASTVQVIN